MITDFWLADNTLLVTRYTGRVTGADLLNATLKKSGDMRLDCALFILADWSRVEQVQVTPEDVRQLVACLRPISRICPNARNASIVNPDRSGNALIAWYKFLADDLSWKVDIFHSHQQAIDWCPDYKEFLHANPLHQV